MQKGNIRVQTENIFPIIKKFLYSDHEIFIRELISNAVDATQKLKTLSEEVETNAEEKKKLGILGALTLYLDFINLFLSLLRIFGRGKHTD